MKYVCDVCGWIYDEAEGAPDMGIAPGQNLKIYQRTFYVHYAL